MATLRNRRKLAALNRKNCTERPRSNLAQNPNVPRSQEENITQVSEENEGRVTKKFIQEFSRTESRFSGALFRLDDFPLNPLIQGHSGIASETSRNTLRTSQRTNEDDSQTDPNIEAGVSQSQTTRNSGPDDAYDIFCCFIHTAFLGRNFPFIAILFQIFLFKIYLKESIQHGAVA